MEEVGLAVLFLFFRLALDLFLFFRLRLVTGASPLTPLVVDDDDDDDADDEEEDE